MGNGEGILAVRLQQGLVDGRRGQDGVIQVELLAVGCIRALGSQGSIVLFGAAEDIGQSSLVVLLRQRAADEGVFRVFRRVVVIVGTPDYGIYKESVSQR